MLGSRVIAISTQLHVIEPCHAAPFVCPVVSRLHLVASSAVASSCRCQSSRCQSRCQYRCRCLRVSSACQPVSRLASLLSCISDLSCRPLSSRMSCLLAPSLSCPRVVWICGVLSRVVSALGLVLALCRMWPVPSGYNWFPVEKNSTARARQPFAPFRLYICIV